MEILGLQQGVQYLPCKECSILYLQNENTTTMRRDQGGSFRFVYVYLSAGFTFVLWPTLGAFEVC